MSIVTVPAIKIADVDLLDGARDKLRVIHLALAPDNRGWQDEQALFSVWASIDHVMNDLDALRDHLCDGGETRSAEAGPKRPNRGTSGPAGAGA